MTEVKITEQDVERFLIQHPKFFHDHLSLLEKLSIPHASGEAISLVSKQLELFRTRQKQLEDQLEALIQIAKDNDVSLARMHQFVLAMLAIPDFELFIEKLKTVLIEQFVVDFIELRIIGTAHEERYQSLFIPENNESLNAFVNELGTGIPKCGRITIEQAKILFNEAAFDVKTAAIIPMLLNNTKALLAIGSLDAERFHPSMGTIFLAQIGEVVAARLDALLPQSHE